MPLAPFLVELLMELAASPRGLSLRHCRRRGQLQRPTPEEPKDHRGEPRVARMAYRDLPRAAAGPQVAKNLVARLVGGRTISIPRQRAARCTFRPEDLTRRVRRSRCRAEPHP